MKTSKEGFARLAKDSCELVYGIICAQISNTALPQTLQENLRKLIGYSRLLLALLGHLNNINRTLTSIEQYAKKELKRNIITRVIKHNSGQGKIFEYREMLRQSLDLFGVLPSIYQLPKSRLTNRFLDSFSQVSVFRRILRVSFKSRMLFYVNFQAANRKEDQLMGNRLIPFPLDTPGPCRIPPTGS